MLDKLPLAESAENSLIFHVLISSTCLAKENVIGCQIQDCLILNGCISPVLLAQSSVDRCFFHGEPYFWRYSVLIVIAHSCESSTVKKCAIGIQGKGFDYGVPIVRQAQDSILEGNVSIDSNSSNRRSDFKSDPNGIYGQALASALFTQHYFEHTLGWDFDTVWQWDAANNRPALRPVGARTAGLTPEPAAAANAIDLLTQQICANLWL